MYVTGPVRATAVGLYISRAERRAFAGPADLVADAAHLARLDAYLSDMVRPYGLALAGDAGAGHSYGEMAEDLLRRTVPADHDVDLVVLAFANPDIAPGRATATYLSHICPGARLAFAVCDQGAAAAFTGLRLIRDYAATGDCRRALLIVVEQAARLYDTLRGPVPAGHTAVALLCGESGPARLRTVRQYAGIPPQQVGALLAGDCESTILVLGNGFDGVPDLPAGPRVVRAARGRPYTGVWWELAGELANPSPARRVALADYDQELRYLCVSTVDIGSLPG